MAADSEVARVLFTPGRTKLCKSKEVNLFSGWTCTQTRIYGVATTEPLLIQVQGRKQHGLTGECFPQ